MTISHAISLPTGTEPALADTLTGLDRSQFALTEASANGNTAAADYVCLESDPDYPVTLHIRSNIDPHANGGVGIVRNSLRLRAYLATSDSVAGTVEYEPVETVIAWNVPGTSARDAAGLMEMVNTLFTLFFHDSTGWVHTANPVVKLNYGIPDILKSESTVAV